MAALSPSPSGFELRLDSYLPHQSPAPYRHLPATASPRPVPVRGLARPVEVKIASEAAEWEDAYRLVADSYRARGYEAADAEGIRFTLYHALPDSTTFVAKRDGRVIATLSMVADNVLLGLPMECIYGGEVDCLRAAGRRLVEVTCLADRDLGLREFVPVFTTLMALLSQYAVELGADVAVITVNPRHRNFYRKVMGFEPLGPPRTYPTVQNHPAEAYLLDPEVMRFTAPEMHERVFETLLPAGAFRRRPMPTSLKRYFASCSTQTDPDALAELLGTIEEFGNPRRWH